MRHRREGLAYRTAPRAHRVLRLARGRGRDRRLRRRRLGRCGRCGGSSCCRVRGARGVDHYMAVPVRLVLAAVEVARDGRVPRDHVDRALEATRDVTDPQLRLPTLAEAAWVLFAAGEEAEADGLLDEIVAALGRNEAYGYSGAWVVPATLVWPRAVTSPCPRAFTPEADPVGRGRRGARLGGGGGGSRSARVDGRTLDRGQRSPSGRRADPGADPAEACGSSTGRRRSGAASGRRRPCGRSTSSAWRSAPQPRNEPGVRRRVRQRTGGNGRSPARHGLSSENGGGGAMSTALSGRTAIRPLVIHRSVDAGTSAGRVPSRR